MDISQLLLSGAKMTAKHCDKCGYPLFEKNGKLICANCTEAEQEQVKRSKHTILDQKWNELMGRLQQTKDLNEIEHILRCLTLLKELM
jgi:UPF0148 protein